MSALAAVSNKRYTFEEYLKLEEQDNTRHEYYNGEVFTKNGESFTHCDICSNINHALKRKLRSGGCVSFQVSVKVEVEKGNVYFYPDIGLTCHADDITDGYLVCNPLLIVEVLSSSTESYDRNVKWQRYRRIPSLWYFLFVSQQQPFIELNSRNSPNALYQYQAYDQLEDLIHFPDLQFSLSLQQVYASIRFVENRTD